ncbi:MAG: hypothetical protein WAT92_16695 [Saprospiraceae bacterium]
MGTFKTEIDNAPKAERLLIREERKVKLSNLTEKQKGLLGAASAGVAGVSLGVIAMALMGAAIPTEGEGVQPPITSGLGGNEEIEVIIHSDAPFADNVDNSMSFGEAFKTARTEVGAGGIFEWKGNLYNTYYKEEWDSMDKSERADFFASIDKDFLPGDEDKEAEILNIVNDDPTYIDDTEDIVIVEDYDNDIIEPEDNGNISVVDSDDDDDIVVIESGGDDEIVSVEPVIQGDDGLGIDSDSDTTGFYDEDIINIDEA